MVFSKKCFTRADALVEREFRSVDWGWHCRNKAKLKFYVYYSIVYQKLGDRRSNFTGFLNTITLHLDEVI